MPGPLLKSFLEFHRSNPWVYDRLVEICYQLHNKGFQQYSMRTLVSVLRFEWDLKTTGSNISIGSGTIKVKLNNNHTPYYARMVSINNPKLANFFIFRKSEVDR